MRKILTRLSKVVLSVIIVFTTIISTAPFQVFAATTTKIMAHLQAGDGNGNAHFGGAQPEAFILSDKKDITNENFSFQMKLGSKKAETRFRFVTKYVDDSHWGYIAFDGANNNWFYEFKNGDTSGWPALSGTLPIINENDMVNISGSYAEDGLHIEVENLTTEEKGEAIANHENFLPLKEIKGSVGFGAAKFGSEITNVYFSDVVIGEKAYKEDEYKDWTLYKTEGVSSIWEPAVEVVIKDEEPDNPPVPPQEGRAWIKLTGGSSNGGGHAYGNANTAAPVLLLNNDKKMEDGGSLSMAVKPSANWGVFYTYVDDNNWLYVGWDSSSKWYYQYKVNGEESYPKIAGLPDPVIGEEMKLSISLNRETLSVDVNGTIVRVTNQNLINLAEKTSGIGRFGVKTNGASSISFADVMYNGSNVMDDKWVFCAERKGQSFEKIYTKMYPVQGSVVDAVTNEKVDGASVRIGSNMTRTTADGTYSFEGLEAGTYTMAVTKAGYQAFSEERVIAEDTNTIDVALSPKADIDLDQFDIIISNEMKAYIGKDFPMVARYVMSDGKIFRANETKIDSVAINGVSIKPDVSILETTDASRTYHLDVKNVEQSINLQMDVKVSVDKNTLSWEVINLEKRDGCAKIAKIDVPGLNLLTVDATEKNANFAGAQTSTTTTVSGDRFIDFDNGFVPSNSDGYLYGFLTNENLSAGLFSNSEIEGDKRVIRNNGADSISLTSAPWYYEKGDVNGQKQADVLPDYPTSDLPCTKIAIANDKNEDGSVDWNDGALAFRSIMNMPYETEVIKDLVNYRIVMNFASMASNPYLVTADNIKKVYLATDGLPQAVMLKGYGNEGHDSANSEYADIAEKEGGVDDFQDLIKIAHEYNTEIGIHVNAQESYPEAKSFNESMLQNPFSKGWGWLDQSFVINKQWDLATQARWKRFVQLYDRINGTSFYDRAWPEAVEDSKGNVKADKTTIQEDAESRPDNMDFIYLDVWYQDAWETRQIAKEINSLGWRFSTEFSSTGEYDSTWQHWSTDASYGGATAKGYNSDIIRFIRNDQRDSQVLNYPSYGGTADNPLLGGYRLYGFEGWGGDKDFDNYILQTFNQNLPTKFLQHYYISDWENYEDGSSPTGNHEKQITLVNDNGDKVVVTRNEEQRSDDNIERTITLNGKKVLDDVAYVLPWIDEDGSEKVYHWNLDGGTTTWDVPAGWENLGNVVMYELSDQGRVNEISVPVINGKITLEANAATAYVLSKGEEVKVIQENFGEADYVQDPGFNSYADGEKLSNTVYTGDIDHDAINVTKADTGDQRLTFTSPNTDVSVSTQIQGLSAGTQYVAEVYVENNSDRKATIEVNTGSKTVSNYTERSILMNYVKSDQKNGSQMQRMQVPFTAERDNATITLSREAGSGETYIDDIRIVEKTLHNQQEDGSFMQDFESVVQGLYPFVLGSAQGINDPVTHLSQANAPYTDAGWNGRVISDTIDGEWSLKHHGANTGIIYQTLPQNYRFEAGKVYCVEFDYQSGPDKAYAMVVGNGTEYNTPSETQYLEQAHGDSKHVKMNLIGGQNGQTWIGLYENAGKAGQGTMGETDFVLDNLVIKEDNETVFANIDVTSLYKGETANIQGNHLDKIEWSSSDDTIATVNLDTMQVYALHAGIVSITAKFPDGSIQEYEIKVDDMVVVDVDAEEYGSLSIEANTEQVSGEPAGSGIKEAAVDHDASTYWHSQWSGSGFDVSEDNPAILKIGFENPTVINGFQFQQRPTGGQNGIVKQFSYRVLNENGDVIASKEHVTVNEKEQGNGAIVNVAFDQTTRAIESAKYIELSIESGHNNFAALAEVKPIRVQHVADSATLEPMTMQIGTSKKMDVQHPENTMLKGIVWSSSDEAIVSVTSEGEVYAVKEGSAIISIKNAAGLSAEAKVTVEKPKYNLDALHEQIIKAEALDLSKYEDGDVKQAFIEALANAKAISANPTSQQQVDDATSVLKKAQEALMESLKPEPEQPIDKEMPTTPNNLKATPEITTAKLSWDASKDNVGVIGYYIYLNGKNVGSVNTTAASIDNLKAETAYAVEVRAYDKAGNVSDPAKTQFTTQKATDSNGGNVTEDKKEPTVKPSKPAETGDHTNVIGLSIILLSSAVVGVIAYKRKKKTAK